MTTTTAQQMLFDPVVVAPPPARPASATPTETEDGLPPPTKAQVFYWAQLCGELSKSGIAGIAGADGWPADLRPTAPTLKALVERGLIARRERVWKLRRYWYARLTALKTRAGNSPPLTLAERPAPHLPTYAELEQWEAVCRWLDVQPGCRVRLPFVGLAPLLRREDIGSPESSVASMGMVAPGQVLLSALLHVLGAQQEAERAAEEHATLLQGMRKYRLVRHTKGCEWVLSSTWREKLRALHAGIDRALRDSAPPKPQPAAARSLCAGLDTWGLNWLVEEKALPAHLRAHLDDLQNQAREVEGEVETPWRYDGVPLRMYQAGVRAKGGKGVSWSYILVNPALRLLIRRTPLGGIVASARLGSECLWRRTPRAALDELDALIHRLWGRDKGRWQVSYAHLAHDVANAPLEREQLDRYVSRSRRRAVYEAARAEVERLLRESRPREAAGANLDWEALPVYDWEAEFADDEELLLADAFAEDGYEWNVTTHGVQQAREALQGEVEQRAMTAFGWGKRLSGVAFSPGGAVSFVMYRKDWEGRLKGKRHMEPLWKAAGWDGREPVTRHEARLVREPIRELRAAAGDTVRETVTQPMVGEVGDDPWVFLDQLQGVWASMVGRADGAPEAVDVAWIRRVVPREGESNRSRWDTDPAWRVVQAAQFTPAPLSARRLVRRRQREHDVRRLNLHLLGVLEAREAVLHPDPAGRDVSLALRDVVVPLERELAVKGEQFDAAVRRKRQRRGLPVPLPARVLPPWPRRGAEQAAAEQERVRTFERDLEAAWAAGTAEAGGDARAEQQSARGEGTSGTSGRGEEAVPPLSLRVRSAELRMRQAYAAFEAAELRSGAAQELTRLEAAYLHAVSAYEASLR